MVSSVTSCLSILKFNKQKDPVMKNAYFGKLSKTALALTAVIVLSACEERSDEADDGFEGNVAPVVTVSNNSPTVQEGDTVSIGFNAIDDRTSYSDLRISIVSSSLRGQVAVDKSSKKITYRAPWLSRDKTFQENIILRVTDEQGLSTEATIEVTVEDIDSPVEVTLLDPSIGFGFENGRTSDSMYLWVEESRGAMTLRMGIKEEDGDEIHVDYEVSSNILSESDIAASFNSQQTELNMSFAIPDLDGSVYEHISLTTTVEDNDAPSEVFVGVTVFNSPSLSIGIPEDLTESEGGVIPFSFSEGSEYPGDYSISITQQNGEPLDFDVPYQINRESQQVILGSSSSFQGSRDVRVTIEVTNDIPNLNGDIYRHVTSASRNVTIVEDRDDDFFSSVSNYEDLKEWFGGMRERRDEVRVTRLMNRYFLLSGHIKFSESEAINSQVDELLTVDYVDIQDRIELIDGALSNPSVPSEEVDLMITEFRSELSKVGVESRAVARDWYQDVISSIGDEEVRLSVMSAEPVALALSEYNALSHFFGNESYGRFTGVGDQWRFNDSFAYFSVTDVSGPSCI